MALEEIGRSQFTQRVTRGGLRVLRGVGGAVERGAQRIKQYREEAPVRRQREIESLKQEIEIEKLKAQKRQQQSAYQHASRYPGDSINPGAVFGMGYPSIQATRRHAQVDPWDIMARGRVAYQGGEGPRKRKHHRRKRR